MSGLYIHIPYCASKCIYCDFYSVAKAPTDSRPWATDYVTALLREWDERHDELTEPLQTIYFGGGTPSLLPPRELQRLCDGIAAHADLSAVTEITLEANPEDVTPDFAAALVAETPVNRVSMGVQTFVDTELRALRRRHDSQRAAQAVAALRAAGIRNISLDLMYGLPGQTPESLTQSIDHCLALQPEHISAYCLTVEEGTLLARRVAEGTLTLPDDEACLRLAAQLRQRLHDAGYQQYEISNYARPGYASRHNSSYWVGTPYLGLGPGAHSYDGHARRSWNAPDVRQYLAGHRHSEAEHLDARDRYHETIMLGLRRRAGIPAAALAAHLEADPTLAEYFRRRYAELSARGLLCTLTDGNIALTDQALDLADDVIRQLFLPEDIA